MEIVNVSPLANPEPDSTLQETLKGYRRTVKQSWILIGLFRSFQHMDCQNFCLTGNKSGHIPSSGLVSRDYPSNSLEWEGIIPSLARFEPTCCRACPCCEAVATFEPLYLAETTSTILVGQMDQCIHLARSVDNETERSGLKSANHIA